MSAVTPRVRDSRVANCTRKSADGWCGGRLQFVDAPLADPEIAGAEIKKDGKSTHDHRTRDRGY